MCLSVTTILWNCCTTEVQTTQSKYVCCYFSQKNSRFRKLFLFTCLFRQTKAHKKKNRNEMSRLTICPYVTLRRQRKTLISMDACYLMTLQQFGCITKTKFNEAIATIQWFDIDDKTVCGGKKRQRKQFVNGKYIFVYLYMLTFTLYLMLPFSTEKKM